MVIKNLKEPWGRTTTISSSNMQRSYTSEELSAEVLKKLKGYIRDEEVTCCNYSTCHV